MKARAPSARRSLRAALLSLCLAVLGALSGASLAVDANTASADELQAIRGIGPAMAARIVEARQREPFRDLDDLRSRVRGIGEKNLRKMHEAGLEVGGGGRLSDAPGQARLHETAAADSRRAGAARPRVEHYVGHPR